MFQVKEEKCDFNIRCPTCLSVNRRLSPLGSYAVLLRKLCKVDENIEICWECYAILKKINLFKDKVKSAQEWLAQHNDNNKNITTPLSNLTTLTQDAIIEVAHSEEPPEIEVIVKIKEESDEYENYDCLSNSDIYDVKEETELIGKKICHKKRYVEVKSDTKVDSRCIALKDEEVKTWMENERFNEFYKFSNHKCGTCCLGFDSKLAYQRHQRHYHNQDCKYICDLCSAGAYFKTNMAKHIRNHNTAWECLNCDYKCYKVQHMNAHLKMHRRHIQCSSCKMKFINCRQFFIHHKEMHSRFECDYCGYYKNSKEKLAKHMVKHNPIHECPECNKRYPTWHRLKQHKAMFHVVKNTEDAYCVLCDRQFNNVALYKRHLATSVMHASERVQRPKQAIPCPECPNVYTRKEYMKNHYKLIHLKQSKYYCVECDKQFLNRTRYLEHNRRVHQNLPREKNKLCTICGRGFSTNRILLNHIRTHTGERPFECQYCTAKFTQKQAMQSHVKYIHLKSKRRTAWHE